MSAVVNGDVNRGTAPKRPPQFIGVEKGDLRQTGANRPSQAAQAVTAIVGAVARLQQYARVSSCQDRAYLVEPADSLPTAHRQTQPVEAALPQQRLHPIGQIFRHRYRLACRASELSSLTGPFYHIPARDTPYSATRKFLAGVRHDHTLRTDDKAQKISLFANLSAGDTLAMRPRRRRLFRLARHLRHPLQGRFLSPAPESCRRSRLRLRTSGRAPP